MRRVKTTGCRPGTGPRRSMPSCRHGNSRREEAGLTAGSLGTAASLLPNLSLILAWILGIPAGVWAISGPRRRVSYHCPLVRVAASLNWTPVLLHMVPKWLVAVGGSPGLQSGLETTMPTPHVIMGAVAESVVPCTVVVMSWLNDLPPREPIWLMRSVAGL